MFVTTRNRTGKIRLAIGMACLAVGPQTLAAPDPPSNIPDAGAIMRNLPRPMVPSPSVQQQTKVPQPTAPAAGQSGKITVKDWNITGNMLISKEELKAAILDDQGQKLLGRELDVQGLWEAAQKVAMYYRERGYLARAWLPKQEIRNGVVEISVVEGRLDGVKVNDQKGVLSNYWWTHDIAEQTILTAQPKGQILCMDDLDRGVLLLNDLPGVSAIPTLEPGSKLGTTQLKLDIESRPLVNGSLDYANAGINAVGEHQFGGSLFINNAFGVGDQATLRLQGGSGNVYGRMTYTVPLGYSGLRVGVAASGMYYVLSDVPGAQFSRLDADGDAWVGGTFASYPWVRSSSKNLYSLAGFDTRRYHNVSRGGDGYYHPLSDKTINVGFVGLQGDLRDQLLGGGFNNASFYLSAGDVDLTGNQAYFNADQGISDNPGIVNTLNSGPRTAGSYQKFTLAFSRLQKVYGPVSFWANFVGQLSTKNLDSSEKFSLGGPFGVRAYPVNEALADEGYLMNFEMRYDVYNNVQLVGFIDHGGVTLHNNPWPGIGPGPNNYTLSGGGFGINWISPGDFAVKLSVAQRIGSNPNPQANGRDVDGTYDTPHFWAQLSKYF